MGNVCGCVRAEKEECYIDPAKAPFTPAKNSSGRKFFKRRKSDKRKEPETCDGAEATNDVVEKTEDGCNPEDLVVSGAYPRGTSDGQRSPEHGSSSRSSAEDSAVIFHCDRHTKPTAQKAVIPLDNFAVTRQLSFPNIPNKLTFLPYADVCPQRKASSLSSIDRVTAQWKTRTSCFFEERSKSDVEGVTKVKSSDCVVYARYFTAGEIARPSYAISPSHVPKDEQVHCAPSPACQVTRTSANNLLLLCHILNACLFQMFTE
ncbi:uncharacterized protein [Dendrobates tinctorius]|uniref:uncharacterized protein n=1 Tax=Dendrobates tinctorius TaxID=92724 RepID=UPI003CC96693